MYIPLDFLTVLADVALWRLLGTIALFAGLLALFAAGRTAFASSAPHVTNGVLLAHRVGNVSVALLGALLGLSCVTAGLFLWAR